jgi:hypothetical protein
VDILTCAPFDVVCIDYLTLEASKGGYQHILVITDHLTRYAFAIPTRNQLATTTLEAFFNKGINGRFLIDWFQGKGLLGNFNRICDTCRKGSFRLVEDRSYSKDGVVWRCTNRKCNKKISIRKESWFSKSHYPLLEQIVKLRYYWIYGLLGDFIS